MKRISLLLSLTLTFCFSTTQADTKVKKQNLKVLYVGGAYKVHRQLPMLRLTNMLPARN